MKKIVFFLLSALTVSALVLGMLALASCGEGTGGDGLDTGAAGSGAAVGTAGGTTQAVQDISLYKYTDGDYGKYVTLGKYKGLELKEPDATLSDDERRTEQNVEAWTAVMSGCTVLDYPVEKLAESKEKMVEYYKGLAGEAGQTLEVYIRDSLKMEYAEFEAQTEELVKNSVAEALVIFAIADAEGIALTDEEYAVQIEKYVDIYAPYGYNTAALLEEKFGREEIIKTLVWDKVLDLIVDNRK